MKEVICLPELVSPLINMPDHIVGIFNYHGQHVPVMNLDSALGHVSFRYKISDNVILFEWDGGICGLIVDETRDFLDLQPDDIDAAAVAELEPEERNPFIAQYMPHDEGVINVLHPLPLVQDQDDYKQFIQQLSTSEAPCQLADAPKLIRGMTLLEQSLMRDRTTSLMESEEEDLSAYTQLVVIRINDAYFGIDLELIRECAEYWQVTPIPGCPDFVLGVINVRGEVLPIVDIRGILNVSIGKGETFHKAVVVQFENMFVGIVCEEIIESVFLQASDMVSGSLTGTVKEEGYIRGIAKFHDEKVLNVLDLQKLLMNGEITIDQTFSQAVSEQQPIESEEGVESGVNEESTGEVSELDTIFRRESKESLRDLRESITTLREMFSGTGEQTAKQSQVLIEKAFNQSHFLMSVARMLGARKMEIVARRVEDLLRGAKRTQKALTLQLVDYLDRGVNGVQALLEEFITEAQTNIDPLDYVDDRALDLVGLVHEPTEVRVDVEKSQREHGDELLVEFCAIGCTDRTDQ